MERKFLHIKFNQPLHDFYRLDEFKKYLKTAGYEPFFYAGYEINQKE